MRQSPEDRFRVGRYESFGPIWEAELNKLWQDPAISLVQMARQLGVHRSTLARHAARYSLPRLFHSLLRVVLHDYWKKTLAWAIKAHGYVESRPALIAEPLQALRRHARFSKHIQLEDVGARLKYVRPRHVIDGDRDCPFNTGSSASNL